MKLNGIRAEDLAGTGLVVRQRYVVPLWASILTEVVKGLAGLVITLVRLVVRFPAQSAALGLLLVFYRVGGWWAVWSALTLVQVGLIGWAWFWPGHFEQTVATRLRGWWRWRTRYSRLWYPAMQGVGLSRMSTERAVFVPHVWRVRSTPVVDTLFVRLLHGHTPEDMAKQTEGLRHVFGAHRVKVVTDAPGHVRVVIYATDPLTRPVPPFPAKALGDPPQLDALPVALAEDGEVYPLGLLGKHVLIAGRSGAGKGSVLWSLIRALGPGIRTGLVRLRGLDPKGGMELYPGRALFTHYADENASSMCDLLEQAVTAMEDRKRRLKASGLRKFIPSTSDPLEVVVVDELAFLTAYTDKATKLRVAQALSVLLSQGRAVGFSVVACLQDPRKEVLPFRDLFTYRIALALAESAHVDMVLGEGALDLGAHCHLIGHELPGVGYVHMDGAAEPVRVRFTWITDDLIRDMAHQWPAPPEQARVIDLTAYDKKVPGPRPTPGVESDQHDNQQHREAPGGETA